MRCNKTAFLAATAAIAALTATTADAKDPANNNNNNNKKEEAKTKAARIARAVADCTTKCIASCSLVEQACRSTCRGEAGSDLCTAYSEGCLDACHEVVCVPPPFEGTCE